MPGEGHWAEAWPGDVAHVRALALQPNGAAGLGSDAACCLPLMMPQAHTSSVAVSRNRHAHWHTTGGADASTAGGAPGGGPGGGGGLLGGGGGRPSGCAGVAAGTGGGHAGLGGGPAGLGGGAPVVRHRVEEWREKRTQKQMMSVAAARICKLVMVPVAYSCATHTIHRWSIDIKNPAKVPPTDMGSKHPRIVPGGRGGSTGCTSAGVASGAASGSPLLVSPRVSVHHKDTD